MKNILCAVLLLLSFSASGSKQSERIIRFHSDILIDTTGRVQVTEQIRVYAAGIDIRRGIVRAIPLYRQEESGKKQKMDFKILSVQRDGKDEAFKTETAGNNREIYIGSGDTYLKPGTYEYTITYESYGHVGFFDTYDELYWNVTGNEWAFNIEQASASVTLPDNTPYIEAACYTGSYGSTRKDCSITEENGNPIFQTKQILFPNEGLTIAVSFQRDIIKRPPPPTRAELFWNKFRRFISPLVCVLIMACFYIFTWRKVGKDPEKPVVIPAFKPPHGWSPATVRYLYKKSYDNKTFTASIVELAVKKAIRIKYEAKKYILEKTGNDVVNLSDEEKEIYHIFFSDRKQLEVSDKNHKRFSKANNRLNNSLNYQWNIKDYFRHNAGYVWKAVLLIFALLILNTFLSGSNMDLFGLVATMPFILMGLVVMIVGMKVKAGCIRYFLIIFGAVIVLPVLLIQAFVLFQEDWVVPIFVSLMVVPFVFYVYLIKAPTELGAKTIAELEGFKMYLETAEENRLNLLTPPDMTPELFERLLPYAIALDVENEWSKKFDKVLQQANYQPEWYISDKPFRYGIFAGAFSRSFNSSVSSARIDPTVSSGSGSSSGSRSWSSGSSGGGFSGGGGGGGGGRGW